MFTDQIVGLILYEFNAYEFDGKIQTEFLILECLLIYLNGQCLDILILDQVIIVEQIQEFGLVLLRDQMLILELLIFLLIELIVIK
jgi:hypothetical protein